MEQDRKGDGRPGKVAQDFDRHASTYAEQVDRAVSFAGVEGEFFVKIKSDHLLRLSHKYLGDAGALDALDIGCGIGAYHPRLAGVFHSLNAADISAQSIAHAKLDNPLVSYQWYAGDRLPYGDNRFDIAFAICVMHHVPGPQWPLFASEMRRVVKPGGLGIIFEHNPLNPVTQYVVRTCPIDKDAELLWPRHLRRLLKGTGLSIVESRSILTVPPIGAAMARLDRIAGHAPFGAQYYVVAKKD